ncbi:hypothetical protein WISP_51473 [Willisornis vidua]|uniref:Uncharacterized protein n=1 Tax=Willisornis vidua TaxID=1566151 RepID=A0ABQ9DDK0_9PASS|nr:hypothetical protein WISP_51473 [Willisornis vidua]
MPVTSLELKGVKAVASTHLSSARDAGVGGIPIRAQYQLCRASPDLRRGFRTSKNNDLGFKTVALQTQGSNAVLFATEFWLLKPRGSLRSWKLEASCAGEITDEIVAASQGSGSCGFMKAKPTASLL